MPRRDMRSYGCTVVFLRIPQPEIEDYLRGFPLRKGGRRRLNMLDEERERGDGFSRPGGGHGVDEGGEREREGAGVEGVDGYCCGGGGFEDG